MKRTIKILIVLLTVALMACCLFACNDKGKAKSEREVAVDEFKNGFMIACYDGWSYSLTSDKVAALPNEAHYLWQKELTELYAKALYSSNIRTQKIKSLANELKTNDELKRILRSEKFSSEKFVEVFDALSFTGADYASVAAEVLKLWVSDGYLTAEKKIKDLTNRRNNLGVTVSPDKVTEFNEVIGELQTMQDGLRTVDSQKQEILSAIKVSQKDFQDIIEFAVDMRASLDLKSILGFENDFKFDELSSKTTDEIHAYVQSIVGATNAFIEKLNDAKIKSLTSSLKVLDDAFKNLYTTDSTLNFVTNTITVTKAVFDFVPLCKRLVLPIINSVDKTLTECAVSVLYKDYPIENYTFIVGKVFQSLYENLTSKDVEQEIEKLKRNIKGDALKVGGAWFVLSALIGEDGMKFNGSIDSVLSKDEQDVLSSLMLFVLFNRDSFSEVISFDLMVKLDPSIRVTNKITQEITFFKRVKEAVLNDKINKNKVGRELLKKCNELVDKTGEPTVDTVYEWAKTIVSAADLAFADIANTANEWIGDALKFLSKEFFEAKADGQTMKSIYDKIGDLFNEVGMKPLKETDAKFAELQDLYKKANVEFVLKFIGILK
ncbi:MAG: hypothetical protein SPD42_03485 [Eubacteriales bacterium]|nr:hypothetical protein [Eubacteriales bacterium]